jgi:hypothetical protein
MLDGVDSPLMGTAVANPDGTVTYTPSAGANGPDSFTYQITDGYGNYATAAVTVDVSDGSGGGLVSNPDSAATPAGHPVTIAVLANDSAPAGDTPTLSAVGAAVYGSLLVKPDGTITYTPYPGVTGPTRSATRSPTRPGIRPRLPFPSPSPRSC